MILPKPFFNRSTVSAAKALLGQVLVHETPQGTVSGRIAEVEAYLPKKDPACHAAKGRTPRNFPMFGPPGRAYVYFCYGNHFLFNVVTEKEGTPGAVLIRALEPLEGLDLMARRRGLDPSSLDLTNGPGKLVQALGIRPAHNGLDLLKKPLYLKKERREGPIGVTTRIGITEGWDLPLRFYLKDTNYLSVKAGLDRPSPGRKKNLEKEYRKMRGRV